jgi:hypothetical protein
MRHYFYLLFMSFRVIMQVLLVWALVFLLFKIDDVLYALRMYSLSRELMDWVEWRIIPYMEHLSEVMTQLGKEKLDA